MGLCLGLDEVLQHLEYIYEALEIVGKPLYQLVQDFVHPQYGYDMIHYTTTEHAVGSKFQHQQPKSLLFF